LARAKDGVLVPDGVTSPGDPPPGAEGEPDETLAPLETPAPGKTWPDDHRIWEVARDGFESGHTLRDIQLACEAIGCKVSKTWVSHTARRRKWRTPSLEKVSAASVAQRRTLLDRRHRHAARTQGVIEASVTKVDLCLDADDSMGAVAWSLVAQRLQTVADRALGEVPGAPTPYQLGQAAGIKEKQSRLIELVDGVALPGRNTIPYDVGSLFPENLDEVADEAKAGARIPDPIPIPEPEHDPTWPF
jgi:hypothetical protein